MSDEPIGSVMKMLGVGSNARPQFGPAVSGDANEASIQKALAWMEYDALRQSGMGLEVDLSTGNCPLERYRVAVEQAVLAEFIAYRRLSPSPASLLAKALAEAEAAPPPLPAKRKRKKV